MSSAVRLQPHRDPPPRGRRGRARAAGDRARDADPGRHGPHAPRLRLAHRRASRSRSTAARRCRRARSTTASPRRRRRRRDAEGARRRLPVGRDRRRSRCSSRPATRCTTRCARTSRSRRRPGTPFTRGQPAALAPDRRRPLDAARRGQGLGDPGDRVREQRRVALHVAPLLGGRRDRRDAAHRLARPLPRPRRARPTTRCRGSRSTSRSSRRSRPRRCRSRRSRRPTSTRSRRPGLPAHPLEASMLQEAANIGAAHAKSTRRRASRRRGRSRYDSHHLYQRARHVQVRLQARSPTRPRPTRSRTGSPALRR